jgi:hypothetical protein
VLREKPPTMKITTLVIPLMAAAIAANCLPGVGLRASCASDHLDSPTVIADPRADIGDVYAWTSADGLRLNLAMTIVGHAFSDKIHYVFHVDSGRRFGRTTATTSVACRFADMKSIDCAAADDRAVGDASSERGLDSRLHGFRVFAGPRDDPFFNNVRGSRDAFKVATLALVHDTTFEADGCARFDAGTAHAILDHWQHTDGGPPKNFLAGWTPASIVVSIDLARVNKGGKFLAVWAETASAQRRIDRAARPLTGNALLAPLGSADIADDLKERYNEAEPKTAAVFIAPIEEALGLYDGYDGRCGNQWLVDRKAAPEHRYRTLATLLADDRLWVDSASKVCTQLFAVERAHLSGEHALDHDCGGRTPNYDAANTCRSLLATGTPVGIDDGVHRDEREHSSTVFPFLAAPDPATTTRP